MIIGETLSLETWVGGARGRCEVPVPFKPLTRLIEEEVLKLILFV